jgi:hypothetical protein
MKTAKAKRICLLVHGLKYLSHNKLNIKGVPKNLVHKAKQEHKVAQ